MPPPRSSAVSTGKASPRREGLLSFQTTRRYSRSSWHNRRCACARKIRRPTFRTRRWPARIWPQARYDEALPWAERALRDKAGAPSNRVMETSSCSFFRLAEQRKNWAHAHIFGVRHE